jgi:hypothetical protein
MFNPFGVEAFVSHMAFDLLIFNPFGIVKESHSVVD